MSELAKIKNNPNLVRDEVSNAVLNVDNKGLDAYKKSRKLRQQAEEQMAALKEQVNNLTTDITEIKHMLMQITRD